MSKRTPVPKWLIDEVTKREGKKQSISRAQVSEVLRHLFDIVEEGSFRVPSKLHVEGQALIACLATKGGK